MQHRWRSAGWGLHDVVERARHRLARMMHPARASRQIMFGHSSNPDAKGPEIASLRRS
jgi:hypothetical protein